MTGMRGVVLAAVLVSVSLMIGTASGATPGSRSAQQLVLELRAAGLPIGKVKVYDRSSDGNHLLGRPGQYTQKVNFRDLRIRDGAGGYSVASGGSLEVFATNADARRRAAYVSAIFDSASQAIPSERDYVVGNVFLRLSYRFTPGQAERYRAALRRLVG
jgi:hypothetical protein